MANITLEFLGTGTSQGVPVIGCECAVCRSKDPRDKRLRTSGLVKVNGSTVLIDAGPDLRQQMLRSKVTHLDAVLLTHEHMDHISGLDDLRAFNYRQRRAMDIHANAATLRAVERIYHYAFDEDRYPGVPELRLHMIDKGSFRAADIEMEAVEVMHDRLPVLGFRIGGLAYITDAKTMDPAQLERIKGVDTLVLNALRRKEHPSHLNLREALEFVERVSPRRTYFTHISHLLELHAVMEGELPSGVSLAYDGLLVEIPV